MDVHIHPEFWKGFRKMCRSKWHPANLWYQFKCWAWYRYTIVRPRYLPLTWIDRDEVLKHVMFEVLSDFIENECSPGHVNWYHEDENLSGKKIIVNGEEKWVRDEMQDIYDWWHKKVHGTYPAYEEELWEKLEKCEPERMFQEIPDKPDFVAYEPTWDDPIKKEENKLLHEELRNFEERVNRECKEYMHRLIEISPYLWT